MYAQIFCDYCKMINTMLRSYCVDNQITDTVLLDVLNFKNDETKKLLLKDRVGLLFFFFIYKKK